MSSNNRANRINSLCNPQIDLGLHKEYDKKGTLRKEEKHSNKKNYNLRDTIFH